MTIPRAQSGCMCSPVVFVMLIGPATVSIISSIPLLYADLQLLKKCGEYIIIMTVVSLVITCCLLPWLLSIAIPTSIVRKIISTARQAVPSRL